MFTFRYEIKPRDFMKGANFVSGQTAITYYIGITEFRLYQVSVRKWYYVPVTVYLYNTLTVWILVTFKIIKIYNKK